MAQESKDYDDYSGENKIRRGDSSSSFVDETQRGNRRRNGNGAKRRQDGRPYDFEDPSAYDTESQDTGLAPTYYGGESTNKKQPSITRRIANVIYSPVGIGVLSLIGIPFLLAAGYWLFVVNGPTPVVKAREQQDGAEGRQWEEWLTMLVNAVRVIGETQSGV